MESLIIWKVKRKKALQWVLDNLVITFHRDRVRRRIAWKNDRGRSSCPKQQHEEVEDGETGHSLPDTPKSFSPTTKD